MDALERRALIRGLVTFVGVALIGSTIVWLGQLHGYDFVILLNFEAWNAASYSIEQMTALIDHELMHCQITLDEEIAKLGVAD